jgi:uncharacterized protein YtpQ (UPF0354 family)
MIARLLLFLILCATAVSPCVRAEELVSPARFTALYAAAARKALPSAKVETTGELALRITFPDGRYATPHLGNAYAAYEQEPGRRDEIIALYVERAVKNLAQIEERIDATLVIPVVRSRSWTPITEAQKDPASVNAVPFESLGSDLVVVYGEDRPEVLRFPTVKYFAEAGLARGALRTLAVTNLRRIIGPIEYKDYGGTYTLIADGTNEASLLLLPEIWTKHTLKVKGDFIVALPTRDLLIVTGSDDVDAISRVRALATKAFQDGPYSISPKLYRYRDGRISDY